jgi:hypothetical protein
MQATKDKINLLMKEISGVKTRTNMYIRKD